MSDWTRYKVEQIASTQPNSLATGPFGSAISSKFFTRVGVPVIRGSNLSLDVGKRLVEEGMAFISEELASTFSRSIARHGDLVFTCWGTIGQVGLIDKRARYAEYVVSNKQMKLTVNAQVADPLFLYYMFSSPAYVSLLTSIGIGSSVPGFNLGQLRSLTVDLPALKEQQAIAAILAALDDKIAANDRVARTSHDLAQAITRRANASGRTMSLSALAVITMGSSPPGESYNENGIGMPFYQGTRDFGARFPGRRVWCTTPVRTASPGSTLVSVRAPVGTVNVARELCCIGRGVASLESRHGTPSVLFHELAGSQEVWRPYESEGTVFGAISKAQMESIRIKSLDASTARLLDAKLSPFDKAVVTKFVEDRSLVSLRDALLPGLMSGEIRVREAENIVEDAT